VIAQCLIGANQRQRKPLTGERLIQVLLAIDQIKQRSHVLSHCNLHIATLSRFIEATGAKLRIVAIYNGEEVEVSLGELAETSP